MSGIRDNPMDASRMPLIDGLKGIACLLIVAHHLAFYGPMSDIAYSLMPTLIDILYQHARIAVQVFFVIAGFLMAAKLAPNGVAASFDVLGAIRQRYLRLAIPYLVAVVLAIACSAIASNWLDLPSIPGEPQPMQLLAHVFFLQGLLDQEALSAGVWYVAIDFQLFALSALVLWFSASLGKRQAWLAGTGPAAIVALTVASLFFFNLDAAWDNTALYFFGAYGLGALAYQATGGKRGLLLLGLLCVVVLAALAMEFRVRIAVAGATMLVLGLCRQYHGLQRVPVPDALLRIGRMSYSIFLIHYPLGLLVNALFFVWFPEHAIANAFGMAVAFCISIAGGALLYRWVESRPLKTGSRLLLPTGLLAGWLLIVLRAT